MVYFIQHGETGPVKIGWTADDPWGRLGALQTGNPVHLRLLGVMFDADPEVEECLHEELAADRLRGEWFRPTAHVLRLARQAGLPPPPPRRGPSRPRNGGAPAGGYVAGGITVLA